VEYDKFQTLLDDEYSFPTKYLFKFIVKPELKDEILKEVGEGTLVKTNPSKNGKFISLTISKSVDSSSDIIDIYKKVSKIEGVISL
jgi:putative lipoic acid-binding regulatory protein